MKEKDALEQMIMDGVARLKAAIISLHQKLCLSEGVSIREMTVIIEKDEETEEQTGNVTDRSISVDELMKNISSIEEEARTLQERNDRLHSYVTYNFLV